MPGSKSQRRAVRIRYQLVVSVFDSSLPVRYRQDAHLKALGKKSGPINTPMKWKAAE
ncbi:hypothetical protein I050019G5_13310 [Collinsella sp. i05-0019-G5]